MDNKDYILDLLSRGTSPAAAAQLAGVSESYVSQLKKDPWFAGELARKLEVNIAERDTRNKKIQGLHDKYLAREESTLEQLKNNLWNLKAGDKIRLLQVLSSKKEPPAALQPLLDNAPKTVVQIALPSSVSAQFVLNGNKEVIGMDNGTIFTPLASRKLQEESDKDFARIQAQQALPVLIEQRKEEPQIQKSSEILDMFLNTKKIKPMFGIEESEVQI